MAHIAVSADLSTGLFRIQLDKYEWQSLSVNGKDIASKRGDVKFDFQQSEVGNITFTATASNAIRIVNEPTKISLPGPCGTTFELSITYSQGTTLQGKLKTLATPTAGSFPSLQYYSQMGMTGTFGTVGTIIVPQITKKGGYFSYGWGEPGKSFTEFTEKNATTAGPIKRYSKSLSGDDMWWSVAQNTTETAYTDGNRITYPPLSNGSFVFHPGKGRDKSAKTRFTADESRTYTFTVKWKCVDADADARQSKAEVYTNARSLGSGWQSLFSQACGTEEITFKKAIALDAGEIVSIEVEQGSGGFNDDSTLVVMSVA
jgi:hypothetical protein